jgi:3-oxoadipate enol-lactonase
MAAHTLPVGEVKISCEVRGHGLPILLVHGFPLDREMWESQIERLAGEFRVIAPDLRGFGSSTLAPRDVETGVGMELYAADVVAVLEGLSVVEPVVLAGFSMGGYVAWQIALNHANRLRGLVLCDTRAAADAEDAASNRLKMAQAVVEAGNASPALAMLEKLLSPETQEQRPEIVSLVKSMIERQSADGIAAAQRGMARREDVREQLHRIDCPCLGIVGTADVISPPKEMREIVAALPDAQLVEIAGGHLTPIENAAEVTEAIRDFARARSGET